MIRSSAEAVPARNSIPNIAVRAPATMSCHFMNPSPVWSRTVGGARVVATWVAPTSGAGARQGADVIRPRAVTTTH
jgi:hypothetical protein